MQTYRFFLVSIILFISNFSNEAPSVVMAPLSASTSNPVNPNILAFGGQSSSHRLIPQKCKAILHNNNGHGRSSKSDPNARRLLTALTYTKLPVTFSPTNWNNISEMGKPLANDLASTYVYNTDNVQFYSREIHNIYTNTLLLLLRKIQSWLDSDESLESIEYYLGFDEKTIDLLNSAMTEMHSAKCNDKKRNNNCLESLFFYSCDIKNMTQNKDTVKEKFEYFIKMFEISNEILLYQNEVKLKKDLKRDLKKIVDKTITTAFKVSIDSMKMRILSDSSRNEIVNSIKKRQVYLGRKKSIQQLVESYATESDGVRINSYHVSILSVLIPDMFGYVYNHFQLLYNLREYEIDDYDKNNIENFSKFMGAFISTFVYRFFEFKRELSLELLNAMNSVMFFLDPSQPYIAYEHILDDEEQSILNDPDMIEVFGENKSINNYYNKSERNFTIDNCMKLMMDDTVEKLLDTCTGEPLESWKNSRFSKIVDQKKRNKKENLMNLLRENNDNAFNTLNIFSNIFRYQ